MQVLDETERRFEGLATIQTIDKDDEVIIRDKVYGQFPIWMKRGAPIIDIHSNRVVGKGLFFEKVKVNVDKVMRPAIRIVAKVFDDHEIDHIMFGRQLKTERIRDCLWAGANKSPKEKVTLKSGKVIHNLNDIELYEVSVCKSPANKYALITNVNDIAKSKDEEELAAMDVYKDKEGNEFVRCTSEGCYVVKDKLLDSKTEEKPTDLQNSLYNSEDKNKAEMPEDKDDKIRIEEEEKKKGAYGDPALGDKDKKKDEKKSDSTTKKSVDDKLDLLMNATVKQGDAQNTINMAIMG